VSINRVYSILVKARQVIEKIKAADPGAIRVGQEGSHEKWRVKGHCTIIVPVHGSRDIPAGTLGSIKRQGEHCLGTGWLR
jgi:predicted RNA binding protein YcfA (HicA-like mRNA interferase family)